jgi:DNA-binding response OmpR family regulator
VVSPREYDVFTSLFQNAYRVVGRETLSDFAWNEQAHPLPNTVVVYVGYLRRKPAGCQIAIETVRRTGYALVQACVKGEPAYVTEEHSASTSV